MASGGGARRHPRLSCARGQALGQRPEGLLARGGGDQLVQVPGIAGFGRRLDLEQVGRVDRAAIGADGAGAEGVVVARHRLHPVHRLDAAGLGRRDAHIGHRLQVVQHRAVAAGRHHGRRAVLVLRPDPLGQRPGAVVEVPVEALGQQSAPAPASSPSDLHIDDAHQQRGDLHRARAGRIPAPP